MSLYLIAIIFNFEYQISFMLIGYGAITMLIIFTESFLDYRDKKTKHIATKKTKKSSLYNGKIN